MKKNEKNARLFMLLASSFRQGLIRLHEARVGYLTSLVAVTKLRSKPIPANDGHELWEVVDPLSKLKFEEFDSYVYVSDISHLIYATAVFDAFMSEATTFLFLRFPGALGDESPLRLDSVLKARSRWDVVNLAVAKRVRDIGYLSFNERLRVLRERFGLKIQLSREARNALEHFMSTRNTVVHEQGYLEVRLTARGQLSAVRAKCPRHPTPLTIDAAASAAKAYEHAVDAITRSVVQDVLKIPSIESLIKGGKK